MQINFQGSHDQKKKKKQHYLSVETKCHMDKKATTSAFEYKAN